MDREATINRLFARRVIDNNAPNPKSLRGHCWLWIGQLQSGDRYGKISIKNEKHYVHRVAASLWLGMPLASPMLVRHLCIGNRNCFNPAHLCVGTAAENNADIVAQGMHRRGEQVMNNQRVASLIGCVRKGKHSIGKWAHLNGISYSTARNAYLGRMHKDVAVAAHARWDKRGAALPSPIGREDGAEPLFLIPDNCAFDKYGNVICIASIAEGPAIEAIPF